MIGFLNSAAHILIGFNTLLFICVLVVLITGVKSGLKRRKFFWLRFLITAPLFCVFTNRKVISPVYDLLNPLLGLTFALVYLVLTLLVWFWFDTDYVMTLFLTICGYTVQHMLACLDWCLEVWIPFKQTQYIVILAVNVLILAFFYFLVARKNIGIVLQSENRLLYIIITIITLIVICFLNYMYYLGGAAGVYLYLCETTLAISLMVAQYGIVRLLNMQKEKEITEWLLIAAEKQRKLSESNMDIINVKYHDLKRQLEAIKEMGDASAYGQYIAETEKAIEEYGLISRTGNKTIDAILTQKKFECRKRGIVFSHLLKINNKEALKKIDKIDMYVLLSNALDNAIEAVKNVEPEHRIITLEICDHNDFIKIHVDNYCAVEPKMYRGNPVTTKADKTYHGYGIKSMKMTAQKYNGNVVIGYHDNMFCLDILLQTTEQSENSNALENY